MAAKIIYTYTDEAPMLATYAFLPIIQRFAKPLGIDVSKASFSYKLVFNHAFSLKPGLIRKKLSPKNPAKILLLFFL